MKTPKLDYLLRQLKSTKGKWYENYVITRIIHSLPTNIKYVTQQYVKRQDGHALIDLYLPQLNIAIEVDEGQHSDEENKKSDKLREIDITSSIKDVIPDMDLAIKRIPIYNEDDNNELYKIDEFNLVIDKKIDEILQKIKVTKFDDWDPDEDYGEKSIERYRKKGMIDCKEDVAVRRSFYAVNIFKEPDNKINGWQRAAYKLFEENGIKIYLWFPKLYETKDWKNSISEDGNIINTKCVSLTPELEEKIEGNKEDTGTGISIVFAHGTDNLGHTLYRFKGIFKGLKYEVDGETYEKVSDTFPTDVNKFEKWISENLDKLKND